MEALDDLDYVPEPVTAKSMLREWRAPLEVLINFRGQGYNAFLYACMDCGQTIYGGRENDTLPPSAYCFRCTRPHLPSRHTLRQLKPIAAAVSSTPAESVTAERICENCGADISHRRPQATTCGASCRKAVSRRLEVRGIHV